MVLFTIFRKKEGLFTEVFQIIISYVLNSRSVILVPLIILILGLLTEVKLRRVFVSVLTLGIVSSGVSMVIGYMSNAVSPASEALAENMGVSSPVLDLGWIGAASIIQSQSCVFILFAVTIGVNSVLLLFNWTEMLNVDMQGVWGKALATYLVYYVSGSLAAGFLITMVRVILELKLDNMFQKHIQGLTGIPLVAVTHFVISAAVLLLPLNMIVGKIPALNKRAGTNASKKEAEIFSRDPVMGLIIGLGLGFVAAYDVSGSPGLAIQTATALGLFPTISGMFMQSLSPLTDAIPEFMKRRFKDRRVYIGLDWPILAGRSKIWVTAILLVPMFIGYTTTLPGNQVLPLAGVINYSIMVGGLLLTGRSSARMLISRVITIPIYPYGAIYLVPIFSGLIEKNGVIEEIKKKQLITWSSIEGPESRVPFAETFNRNILAVVECIIFLGLPVLLYKYMVRAKVPSKRYARL